MKNLFKVVVVIVLFVFCSCTKEMTNGFKRKASINGTTLTYDMGSKPKTFVYETIFDDADGMFAIKAHNTISGHGVTNYYSVKNNILDRSATPIVSLDGGQILLGIDGYDPVVQYFNIESEGRQYISTENEDYDAEIIQSFFGEEVGLSVDGNTSTSVPPITSILSVPSEIELLSPNLASMTSIVGGEDIDGLPLHSKSDDLILMWNQDENNSNGVLVYLAWTGMMYNYTTGRVDYTVGYSNYYVVTDDDGEYTLDASLFEEYYNELGEGVMFDVMVMRGNIEVVEASSKVYHYYAVTESGTTPILLIDGE